jgi:Raf kinase inhibitor-like YbhB/YbcL family protein
MANPDIRAVSVRATDPPKSGESLKVTSTSFGDGAAIPLEHVFTGCGGKNDAPQLSWSGAPAGTKSFAITCFDPDAPTGSGYWHWLAFDIAADAMSLEAGAGNHCRSGFNDYGMTGYGGPCPPKGDIPHRYVFTVYALDVDSVQGAGDQTTGATLNFMMRGHLLATGSITGTFAH